MYKMKIVKLMAALTVAALFCGGCADSTPTVNDAQTGVISDAAQGAEGAAEDVEVSKSVKELYEEIQQKVSLQSPQCMDEEFISNYYGIDVSILEEYVFSMSEDAAQAETIIILKVKDAGDLEGLTDCLQTIVEEKKNEMENYIPEQFAIVEKSEVRSEGNYIWLIISDNADEIADIVESGLL